MIIRVDFVSTHLAREGWSMKAKGFSRRTGKASKDEKISIFSFTYIKDINILFD